MYVYISPPKFACHPTFTNDVLSEQNTIMHACQSCVQVSKHSNQGVFMHNMISWNYPRNRWTDTVAKYTDEAQVSRRSILYYFLIQ